MKILSTRIWTCFWQMHKLSHPAAIPIFSSFAFLCNKGWTANNSFPDFLAARGNHVNAAADDL